MEVAEVIRPLTGELRTTVGAVVTIVKFNVALALLLLALSVQRTYQEWFPSAMPLIVKTVAVLLMVEELVLLRTLSRKMEQFMVGARLSVAVKLKVSVDDVNKDWLAGELGDIVGAVVSTVKVLVALVLVRLAASVQETFQLWVPWLRPE